MISQRRSPAPVLLTRREALRRGTLFVGSALLSSYLLPSAFAQTPAAAGPVSVDADPQHPIAQMRRTIAQAPLEVVRITDRHFMLSGHGGNIGVFVGEESLLLVDSGTGLPPATEKLREAIKSLSNLPVRYLINTHWHFDHTDGNANVRSMGATILAHRAVRDRLSSPQTIAFFNALFPASQRTSLPTVTFDHRLELDLGNELIELTHIPNAHTDSDSIVRWPVANVIQTGDIFFSGTFPFIDGGTGGSMEGMIAGAETILKLADANTRIIPGHGPAASRDDLVAYTNMLRTVRDRLERLRASGKSVDDAVAAKPLADLEAKWGQGLFNADAFVRIVYGLPRLT
jgi:cyclase